jgi:hypothetical protein
MCAEAVPWRCHRSLIADVLVVRGFPVEHIMRPGVSKTHALHPLAVVDQGVVRYPSLPHADSAIDEDLAEHDGDVNRQATAPHDRPRGPD